MAAARCKSMGRAWLLLFLAASPVLDAVAVGNSTAGPEMGPTWSSAPLRVNGTYLNDIRQDHGDDPVDQDEYYKRLSGRRQVQSYLHLAILLGVWMPMLTFMIMGDPVARLEQRCSLRDATNIKQHTRWLGRAFGSKWTTETRLGVFRPFSKVREKGVKGREITFDNREGDSNNVIVSGLYDNQTITVVPYTAATKRLHAGFVATMVHRAMNVAGQKFRPLSPNSLLIALDCVALTDKDMCDISDSDLQSFIEKTEQTGGVGNFDRVYFGRVKMTFLDLDETEHEYCPIPDQAGDNFDGGHLEIVPAGSCKYQWPNGQPARRGVRTWMSTWKLNANEEIQTTSSDTSTAARINLGISRTGTMGWGRLTKLSIALVLVGVSTYLFAWMPLNDFGSLKQGFETSNLKSILYTVLFVYPSNTKGLANFYMGLKLFGGGLAPVVVLGMIVLLESHSRRLEKAVAFANNGYDFQVLVAWMVLLLWAPAYTYYNAVNTTPVQGMAIRDIQTILAWIGLQLALLYWANASTAYINQKWGYVIPELLSPLTGQLVLGLIGVLSAFVALLSTARSNEDMGTGYCEVDWLGHTLRTLARDQPGTFPSGYTLDLKCSNLGMTFSDIFNTSVTDGTVREFQREYKFYRPAGEMLHALREQSHVVPGEVCILTCTPPPSDSTTPASSSPITCDDKGAKGARWSLELNVDELAPALCPHPVKLNLTQAESVGETKLGLTSADETRSQTTMTEVVDAAARRELEDTRRELAGAQRELQEQRAREGLLASEVASLRQMVKSSHNDPDLSN